MLAHRIGSGRNIRSAWQVSRFASTDPWGRHFTSRRMLHYSRFVSIKCMVENALTAYLFTQRSYIQIPEQVSHRDLTFAPGGCRMGVGCLIKWIFSRVIFYNMMWRRQALFDVPAALNKKGDDICRKTAVIRAGRRSGN